MSTATPIPKVSVLIIGITCVAALAGLLFGFDVGVISGAQLSIHESFTMTPMQNGFMVSSMPFGALVAAALSGKFNDLMGRRNNLLLTAVLFIVGTLGCAFAGSITMLIVARLVVGVAIGVGSFSAPLYIAEMAEEQHRGGLVTLNQLAIVIGILCAFIVDYLFTATHNWRAMFFCGVVPAIFLFGLAWRLPESPRWLMVRNKFEQAKSILQRIHGEAQAEKEFGELMHVVQAENNTSEKSLHKSFYKVLWLGILVSILTQAVGINAIIYYAPTIFKLTGFSHNLTAVLATIGVGLVNVIFTIVAIRLLDVFGRRPLLLVGMGGIVLSLILMVIGFSGDMTHHVSLAWVTFAAAIMFVACQAFSTGPMCWLIPSEIFPTNMRGFGMGVSVAFNWGTNVVVAFFFPVVLSRWGGVTSFAIFLAIAVIAWCYFYKFVPETKGVSLEHIEENLYAGKSTRELGE
jgi:sugar porter (SP) family MFS transporter